MQVYNTLRTNIPSHDRPTKPAIDVTDSVKVGVLTAEQRATMLTMQFIVWRERCAQIFINTSKEPDDRLEDILWQLQFFVGLRESHG